MVSMVPGGASRGFLKCLNGQSIVGSACVLRCRTKFDRARLLKTSQPPGTSTPRRMQGDGKPSAMIETSTIRASAQGGLFARWRGLRTAAAAALVCGLLAACTGEQFQKGY